MTLARQLSIGLEYGKLVSGHSGFIRSNLQNLRKKLIFPLLYII